MYRSILGATGEHLAVVAVGQCHTRRLPSVLAKLETRRVDAVHDDTAVDGGSEITPWPVPADRRDTRLQRRQRVRELQRRCPKIELASRRRGEAAPVGRPCDRCEAERTRSLQGELLTRHTVVQHERAVLTAGDEGLATRLPRDRQRAERVSADLAGLKCAAGCAGRRSTGPCDQEHLALAARYRQPSAIGSPREIGHEIIEHHRAAGLEHR